MKLLKQLAFICLCLFCLHVAAGGIDNLPDPVSTESSFFFGGGFGISEGLEKVLVDYTRFPNSAYRFGVGPGLADSPTTHRFGLLNKGQPVYFAEAGYNFNSYIGVYFDYIDWGSQPLTDINGFSDCVSTSCFLDIGGPGISGSLDSYSFGPGVIGYWPIGEGFFDFIASFGVEFITSTLKFKLGANNNSTVFAGGANLSTTATNQVALSYSTGAQFNFKYHMAMRLIYKGLSKVGSAKIAGIHYNSFIAEGLVVI